MERRRIGTRQCPCQKGKSWSQAFLAKTVKTGDKNRGVTEAMHRIESCERSRAFPERVGPRILSLQNVDYLGTSDYFSSRKKKNNLNEQNFDGGANWSGVVNFHCMQMSLVMSMRFIFGDN